MHHPAHVRIAKRAAIILEPHGDRRARRAVALPDPLLGVALRHTVMCRALHSDDLSAAPEVIPDDGKARRRAGVVAEARTADEDGAGVVGNLLSIPIDDKRDEADKPGLREGRAYELDSCEFVKIRGQHIGVCPLGHLNAQTPKPLNIQTPKQPTGACSHDHSLISSQN